MNTTQQLQAPFHPNDIEWRVQRESRDGSSVLVLAYVTNRAIQARLDEVFGPFGWQNSFHEGPQGGLICKIGAQLPTSDSWVWKEDGAENTQVEAVKGGLSSAMKRAAVQWGIGRYLYNLTDNWAKVQDKKSHWSDDRSRKAKYQEAFDKFGDGDTMKISEFDKACEWVTQEAKKSAKDPIAKKLPQPAA
jgi:hypothetical protein